MNVLYFLIPAALLAASVWLATRLVKRGHTTKKALSVHFLTLALIMAVTVAMPLIGAAEPAPDEAAPAAAAAETDAEPAPASDGLEGLKYIGAALAVGMAGIGGGLAVAAGAPAAIGAMAEDPKTFGKSLVFVALGEGFGLYGLLIGILILVR